MSIKTIALSTLLLVSASTVMAAPEKEHDESYGMAYATQLRIQALEPSTVTAPSYVIVDRDENTSTLHATELRKQAASEKTYHATSYSSRDRDEKVSTLHATQLRKQASLM
ncbi:hypothetical protein L4D76_06645 [Photobacterium sagamiensis]|uniref:hypothetical protein n=1 Tax=Photobacterium sagamiensis TaxID=2910241 RepID=UPI003D12133D